LVRPPRRLDASAETNEKDLPVMDRMVIAVDLHDASWTAAAVNPALQPPDTLRVIRVYR
jgi:hypothetical protein